MARKANPALLGGFVVGAVALAVAGLVVFGGGKLFRSTQPWVANFDESIKGLSVGAPVLFRGVKLGAVTDIQVVVDRKNDKIHTPVYFALEADRITELGGGAVQFEKSRAISQRLFQRGLRAQLETQSFVTGQLAINLDFYPNTPIKLVGGTGKYPECPTIPSAKAALGRSLEDLNTAEMAKNLQEILQGAVRLVNGPELKGALAAANTALTSVSRLMANADAKVTTLGSGLDRASGKASETLEAIQVLVKRVDSQTITALNETLRDTQQLVRRVDAETVPAATQVLADLRPLVEEIGKAVAVARGALEQAEATLTTVDGALDERSSLRYEIRVTLQEVAAAARAFRVLSGYLERNPNAIIFGKPAQ